MTPAPAFRPGRRQCPGMDSLYMKKTNETTASTKGRQLLQTARELFLKWGFLAVKISDIARQSGLSKRTIYRLHESREQLIAAVIVHDFEAWEEWFFDAVDQRRKAGESLLAAFHALLALWTRSPDFQGCLFARVLLAGNMMPEVTRRAAAVCAQRLLDFFQEQAAYSRVSDRASFARTQLAYTLLLLGGAAGELGEEFRDGLVEDMQALDRAG